MRSLARSLYAGALAAAVLTSSPLMAQCDALDAQVLELLRANARSAAVTKFSGVLTLRRGGDMQIVEISHDVRDGLESAVMSRLTGRDAPGMRPGQAVECVHPGLELRLGERAVNAGDSMVCALASHYRFRVVPGERIAGRDTLRLRVEPRDMYRYGHVLDLDRESALVLRAATLGADQAVLEQYQFASLQLFNTVTPDSASFEYAAAHPQATLAEPAGPGWHPAWLPGGFVPTDAAPASSPRKSYTDGMASFSVFFEPMPGRLQPGEGVERQGSTLAYTRGTRLQGQAVLITVLGEVPLNTARMVADAVRLQRP